MTARLRLADLLGGLSIATDLGYRLPPGTALRSCLIGTRLAGAMGLPDEEVRDVYYTTLLFHVGCVAYAYETYQLFGDDLGVNRAVAETDLTDVRDIFTTLIPRASEGQPPAARLRASLRMAAGGRAFGRAHNEASCELARDISRRLGLAEGVSLALYDVHEWWDGSGPRRQRSEEIALAARIARVASEASETVSIRGGDYVVPALERRAGKSLDPAVVACLASCLENVLSEAAEGDPRQRMLHVEPAPILEVPELEVANVARVFGDIADLKMPFTHGHSSGVATLCVEAAGHLGLDSQTLTRLEVAAYLHDLGRVGVSNKVWAKPGPLTSVEWEEVRLHAYHSERILASTMALAPMATIVGMHHERVDGSGYYRGSRGRDIDAAAAVLGCADAFQAMTQPRPHRDALSPERAGDELLGEARAGRFDGDIVGAVLEAAGLQAGTGRKQARPGGLSEREVEVLQLVAKGCSNPEIGRRLGISRRTAEHHVQHVYTKLGVSTRAAAALFALEHGLIGR